MPFGAPICGSCGSTHEVTSFGISRPLEAVEGVSVWLCQSCRGMVVERRRAASLDGIVAAKARGVQIGGFRGTPPSDDARRRAAEALTAKATAQARPVLDEIARLRAITPNASAAVIAEHLNGVGIKTPRGGSWTDKAVYRVLNFQGRTEAS